MSVKRTLGLTRRSLLRGAATAGAAGLAVTALAAGPAEAETTRHPGPDRQRDLEVHHEFDDRPAEPITVHIRDHRSGEIDVFWGTQHTRLHDRDLASRIAGSAR